MDQFPQSQFPQQQPPALSPEQINNTANTVNLVRRTKSGASTFYWIAGFSAINSVVAAFGGSSYFVVGLASALFVSGIAIGIGQAEPSIAFIAKMIGLAIGLIIAGIIAIFGYFANKGYRWAFIVGIILYALDALLMLLVQDWLGILFHLYFLWLLFAGLQAFNKLKAMPVPQPAEPNFPQSFGS